MTPTPVELEAMSPAEFDAFVRIAGFDARVRASILNLDIHHGNAADFISTVGSFDLVVTDPPYAMGGVDGEWRLTAEVAIALRDAAKVIRRRDGAMVVLAASSGRSVEFMSSAVGPPTPIRSARRTRPTASRLPERLG